MAVVTKFQTKDGLVPQSVAMITQIVKDIDVVAADAAQNDQILVLNLPTDGMRIVGCSLQHNSTLGAACTAQLQVAKADGSSPLALTAATTAAQASSVYWNGYSVDQTAGTYDSIFIVIAGAAIGATARIRVTLQLKDQ